MTLEEAMVEVWRQALVEGAGERGAGKAEVPRARDAAKAFARTGFCV
jgi:hypothetical protein